MNDRDFDDYLWGRLGANTGSLYNQMGRQDAGHEKPFDINPPIGPQSQFRGSPALGFSVLGLVAVFGVYAWMGVPGLIGLAAVGAMLAAFLYWCARTSIGRLVASMLLSGLLLLAMMFVGYMISGIGRAIGGDEGFAWALGLIAVSAVATVLSSLSKKRRNSRRGDRIAVPVTPRMALGCSAMMAAGACVSLLAV